MDTLEDRIRELVREGVREAVEDALPLPGGDAADEGWRSRVHRVHPDTRLPLSGAADALDVSERTVRRYIGGEGEHPELPARRGPTGLTVRAGDLVAWLEDVEGGNRFRRTAGGAA